MKYLEYIELDGRSFIGTKLSPDDPGLTLEFWVKPGRSPWGDGQVGNGQYAFFAGAEQGSDIWGIKTADLSTEFVGENCGTYTNGIYFDNEQWQHVVVENGELSVYQVDADGTEYLSGQELFDPSSVSLPNVFIGTLNKEDTDFYDAPCCGVLFGKIIVNGDELLPAEDDEGTQTGEPGTIGWFDEYNGVFYENGGDGSFIAGPYVSTGLEFSPASLSVGSAQTTQAISVTNPDGHFYSVASAPNWVNATALPPYDLSVTINENASGNTARSGDIQVEDTDDGTYYTIPVSQSAGAPIPVPPISITPSAATIGYSGGVITAQVTCGHSWGVSWDDRYGELYVVNNNNAITIYVLPNLSQSAATHSIVFTDKTTSEYATMTITQDAYPSGSTYPFYLGSSAITKAYVGDEEISAAYLGDTLVFGTGGPSGPVVPVEYITSVSGGDGFVLNHTINTGVIDHQMHTDIYYEGLGNCDRIICYMYGDPGVESTYAASRICTTSGGVIVDYAMNRGSFGDRTFALGDHSLRFTDGNVFDIENEQWLYQTGGGTILSGNTILADVSMTKIKKLVVGGVLDSSNAESVLYFVGYAAKSGNTYGIYDMVSGRFITSSVKLTNNRPSPQPPAALGDVVVFDTNDGKLKYIPNSDYNTNDYPTNTFNPVGVVCENQVDNSVCMISLNRVGTNSSSNWGAWGTAEPVLDAAQVPYYNSDISVGKTMNVGREITAALVSGNTEPADFENNMGSVNFGNFPPDGQHTAAIAAYMHETSGTSRGEWFTPAPYDVRDMDANGWNIVSTSLGRLSGASTLSTFWTCLMTKTGYNPYLYSLNSGNFSTSWPWYTYGGVLRAVYRGNITHI